MFQICLNDSGNVHFEQPHFGLGSAKSLGGLDIHEIVNKRMGWGVRGGGDPLDSIKSVYLT